MTLFEFKSPKSVASWQPEDDVVMGGVSDSAMTYADADEDGAARFSGSVSLENGGGFAQTLYSKTSFDLTGYQGVSVRVKGDNKPYELRFETDAERVSYAQSFFAADTWQEVRLAFTDFQPTHNGRAVLDAPVLNAAAVRTVGILVAQEGEFELFISEVRAYRD